MRKFSAAVLTLLLLAGCASPPPPKPATAPGLSSETPETPPASAKTQAPVYKKGLIYGSLRFENEGWVPEAFLLVTDTGTGPKKAGVFYPGGSYCIPDLEPGHYRLSALCFHEVIHPDRSLTLGLDQFQIPYLTVEIPVPRPGASGEILNLKQLKITNLRLGPDQVMGICTLVLQFNEYDTLKEILGSSRQFPWRSVLEPMKDLADKYADR